MKWGTLERVIIEVGHHTAYYNGTLDRNRKKQRACTSEDTVIISKRVLKGERSLLSARCEVEYCRLRGTV
jgi:hypothetical protein